VPKRNGENALNQRALDGLLRHLHPEPAEAAEQYLLLHDKLVSYFEFERLAQPEELADEVLDRMARRLNQGEEVVRPGAYALGVARLVALETRHKEITVDGRMREFVRISGGNPSPNEPSLACLDGCLEKLPAESSALILAYYSGDHHARIENRRRLAIRLGIDGAALRNRALRLRDNLESCVKRCVRSKSV